jgi:hypothetical protein
VTIKDLASRISNVQAIGPATFSADTTPTAIDLTGFQSCAILLSIGAGGITFDGTNKIEFVLTHSDDGTNYANVAATDINGKDAPTTVTNGIVKALTSAHASADVSEIGYTGGKRYLKLLADFSGTHGTGTPISAVVAKGNPLVIPAN